MSNQTLELKVPNSNLYLPVIQDVVEKFSEMRGFQKNEIMHLQLGVEEVVSNINKHAFDENENKTFDLIFVPSELGLEIIIKDMGIPFDPSLMPEFKPEELSESFSDKGLGVFLLKQFMDDVSFVNRGKKGKETHLFKYLKNKSIENYFSNKELKDAEKDKVADVLPKGSVSYYVRYIKPSEAVGVSRCAYSSYGYTYAYVHMYYPERVNELNKAGNLVSHIAVTDDEEIIGHAALAFQNPGDKTAELGIAFVKPKYRGQGCLKELSKARLATARKMNLTGVYMHAVTTHVFSQKPAHKNGFKDCALYIAKYPHVEFKSIIDGKEEVRRNKQRESVVLSFLFLEKPEMHRLFVPEHHKDMISKIYESLGANPEMILNAEKDNNIADESVIKLNTDNELLAVMKIEKYGKDLLNEISKSLKSLCIERFETINLYQKMTDINILHYTEEFEKLGFFFCGILPGSNGDDSMILQYLNNQVIDYDIIKLDSDIGNKMLQYIKQEDPNKTNK